MKYSVIIPVYNEEDSVGKVYQALQDVMRALQAPYEIVFIDDGSKDQTLLRLQKLSEKKTDIKVISLRDHVGKSESLQAGFDNASGEIYICMDGDGQDDARDIPKLLNKMAQGYDVVYGWRLKRQDGRIKRFSSWLAGGIRRIFTKEQIHDVGCALRVFRKKDIQGICLSRGLHRFFSYIMEKKGYKIAEVEVNHYSRQTGISKYGIVNRLFEGMADLFLVRFTDIDKLMAHHPKYQIREYKVYE
ncbi:MAG: glycosyltransferase family 2 protein [Candidatus Omnitrophica bacterium]|nr:glycosyltransferase family 2 protein [Candidatus Omnitrophota bacterium]